MNNLNNNRPYDIILLKREEKIMALGRPIPPIDLAPELKEELQSMARSRSLPYGLVRRAKIILMAAEGMNNKTIAISSFGKP
jgi:hypothetical protein